MKLTTLALLIMLASCSRPHNYYQGLVTDTAGRPLAGVIIQALGSSNKAKTTYNGYFKLRKNPDRASNLIFSKAGFKTDTLPTIWHPSGNTTKYHFLGADTTRVQLWPASKDAFVSYVVDPKKHSLKLYWKDKNGVLFQSIDNLKTTLEAIGETLLFATNGGMYKEDHSPVGLLVQEGKTASPLNIAYGEGNFYMNPNGVFYTTLEGGSFVCKTEDFKKAKNVAYATQSGPMLVVAGRRNGIFNEGSVNYNIRNGVGILPNGKALLAMSKSPVNLYDFATYFQKAGCKNALYLDGYVSQTYLPAESWKQLHGNFGVIIGVTALKGRP